MGKWNVRLLSAGYKRVEDYLRIELYGITDDGKSICVYYKGFGPYFEVIEPSEELLTELSNDENVKSIEKLDIFLRGKIRKAAKVFVTYPWLVPDFRSRIKSNFEVVAADIPFHHRFLYDVNMNACFCVEGEEISGGESCTDITVNMYEGPSFTNIEPFNPDLKVLSFDIENSIKEGTILAICYVTEENGVIKYHEPIHGDERSIIDNFTKIIQKEDPDVITGYNIDNYDIPTIMERGNISKASKLLWGRDYSEPKKVGKRGWKITGRLVVDAWWSAKMQLRPKQETLNHIAKTYLGEEKLDVDPSHMDEEWANNKDKVLEYCKKDAELALKIIDYLEALRKLMDLAAVSKLPLEDVHTSGSSTLIDSILIREADRTMPPTAVPMTSTMNNDEDAIEGGYVHDIEPGLYHWVIVLDFKSMYPSLIIRNNICFTTLNPEGTIVAPNGAKFLSKDVKEGLLPRILSGLMKQRDEIKKKMKESKTPEEHTYYDGLQNAVKVLMNAFYGVFASSFYRFTDHDIGSAITGFARETVKKLITELNEKGLKVVYSDTDSLFIQSPYDNLEDTVKFGKEIAEKFSQEVSQMEFEKVLEPLFSHGKKKRYVGRSVWPENKMLIRGYEIRRSDAFEYQSSCLMSVFEKVLDDNPQEAIKVAKECVSKVLSGDVPIEDLVISRTSKSFNSYKDPDTQVNVIAAKKMIALGYDFTPGMKVSWIVTDSKKTPQEVEPYISGRPFTYHPDYRYYAERLSQTLARVTEFFGWSEKDLIMGSQQVTLFDSSFEESPAISQKKSKPASKKTSKTTSLNDFF